jgi:hypothetical protein
MLILLMMLHADFREDKLYEGRSTVIYNTVTWTALSPLPVGLPSTAKQGSLKLGATSKRLRMFWNAETHQLWLDFNDNDQYEDDERITLTSSVQERPVTIDGRKRNLLVRLRGDEPVFAVRGFVTGIVAIEGQPVKYLLLDGNSDGCFHAGRWDRLTLDVNGDSKLDPLTEQFNVGEAIRVGEHQYLFVPNADGKTITVRRRPSELGAMRFTITRQIPGKLQNVHLELTSEFGEYVVITDLEKEHKLPVGHYQLTNLKFGIALNQTESWTYSFYGTQKTFDIVAEVGKTAVYELLPQLKLRGTLAKNPTPAPGETTWVQPDVIASNGLTLYNLETTERFVYARCPKFEAKLMEPGSVEQDRNIGCLH